MNSPRRLRSVVTSSALFLGSLLLALLIGELVVRAAIPVRNVGPTFSEYDPLYGKRLKKSFHCTRTAAEFTMEFSTNSLGFRGPEPASFPAGGVLFLGDSFTSGYGVNDGEEFPELVRRELNRTSHPVPVINAGSGNIGNGYWLRFLRAEAGRFQPRLVVFGFCVNDFADNLVDGLYALGPDGRLVSREGPPRQEGARRVQELIEAIPGLASSHLVGLARQAFSESSGGIMPEDTTTDRLTWTILEEVFAECRHRGVPVILLTIGVNGDRLARLRWLAEASAIPVLVAPPREERPELYYHVDGHWNAAGHAFIAREMVPLILHQVKDPS